MLATSIQRELSPLNQNRKRIRNQNEEVSAKEMDLDLEPKDHQKPITSLNLEQLQISQKIAIEQLKNTLFLTLELEPEPNSKNPFAVEMEDDNGYEVNLIDLVT
jgi:hypothetical protein